MTDDGIIQAALSIVDAEGIPALSMRRLGAALGVEAMAIYKHFPNKAALLDAVVAAVLRDLSQASAEEDWRETFRATFLSLRSALRAHPNALPLVTSRPLASPQLTGRLASTRDVLLRSGLPEVDVLHLLHAAMSLTIGYLWLEAGGFVGELPHDAPFLRSGVTGELNGTTQTTTSWPSPWNRDDDFEAGLELLLADSQDGWRRDLMDRFE